jgi:hypothetical protein
MRRSDLAVREAKEALEGVGVRGQATAAEVRALEAQLAAVQVRTESRWRESRWRESRWRESRWRAGREPLESRQRAVREYLRVLVSVGVTTSVVVIVVPSRFRGARVAGRAGAGRADASRRADRQALDKRLSR